MRRIFFCIINFILLQTVKTQNLVQNGSFEIHGNLDCVTCPIRDDKFSSILPAWKEIMGDYPLICDCQYKGDKVAIEKGRCQFNKAMPHHGKSMIEMEYLPYCWADEFKTRGCASYIGTSLDKPLEISKIYEVSFWIYILPSLDSAYTKNIGFNLYPDIVRNPTGKMLEGSNFLIEPVIYNKWYQVKWLLRPICNLQFLVLGVFKNKNGPPVNSNGHNSRFYIDDIWLKSVENTDSNLAPIIPHCRYAQEDNDKLPTEIKGVTCFFETNDSTLSMESMDALDSFAVRAKQTSSAVFTISGHTDNIGSNHQQLSKARVKSVLEYLAKKHNIPTFRFIESYLGDLNPVASNNTESGRKRNRNVLIQQTDDEIADVIYRNLLLNTFAGNKNQAFKILNIWLNVSTPQKKIYVIFDPRLSLLQSDNRWDGVVKNIKASYKMLPKPQMAFMLDSLGREDQKCRTLKTLVENLNSYWETMDSIEKRFDVFYFPDTAYTLCTLRDAAHFQSLQTIIGNNYWPKISEVGKRPVKSAFLVLVHTDDSTKIAHYLPIVKQRCQQGEAEWQHYVMLYDRLQVIRGLPQRYGTQYKPLKNGDLELFPLEDPDKVDQWRKELGIEPMKDSN